MLENLKQFAIVKKELLNVYGGGRPCPGSGGGGSNGSGDVNTTPVCDETVEVC
ncbi:hypothetical protein [Tenacibaculum agarivorans]|uniref:hypothetical protein n=1 Tax=Tenacibaculum agarivorans TaxID=1908389 RepID=UPI000A9A9491|nr:hypothetical protein [Tenacibaculum agarivorans]